MHRFAVLTLALAAAACGDARTPPEPAAAQTAPAQPRAPIVPVRKAADWCAEHGVPESVCTRCNDELVAGFKAKGDWCAKHGLPTSQCVACDPSLEAKLRAAAPPEADAK
jgi:hypothetical protein